MNFIYPAAKDLFLTGQLSLVGDPIVGLLVNANYIASFNHAVLADILPATRVASSGTLANRTVTRGVFNADPLTLPGVFGVPVQAVVLVKQSGVEASSPLIAYLDQSPDLPKNPNGGDLTIHWDTGLAKIFSI